MMSTILPKNIYAFAYANGEAAIHNKHVKHAFDLGQRAGGGSTGTYGFYGSFWAHNGDDNGFANTRTHTRRVSRS